MQQAAIDRDCGERRDTASSDAPRVGHGDHAWNRGHVVELGWRGEGKEEHREWAGWEGGRMMVAGGGATATEIGSGTGWQLDSEVAAHGVVFTGTCRKHSATSSITNNSGTHTHSTRGPVHPHPTHPTWATRENIHKASVKNQFMVALPVLPRNSMSREDSTSPCSHGRTTHTHTHTHTHIQHTHDEGRFCGRDHAPHTRHSCTRHTATRRGTAARDLPSSHAQCVLSKHRRPPSAGKQRSTLSLPPPPFPPHLT